LASPFCQVTKPRLPEERNIGVIDVGAEWRVSEDVVNALVRNVGEVCSRSLLDSHSPLGLIRSAAEPKSGFDFPMKKTKNIEFVEQGRHVESARQHIGRSLVVPLIALRGTVDASREREKEGLFHTFVVYFLNVAMDNGKSVQVARCEEGSDAIYIAVSMSLSPHFPVRTEWNVGNPSGRLDASDGL